MTFFTHVMQPFESQIGRVGLHLALEVDIVAGTDLVHVERLAQPEGYDGRIYRKAEQKISLLKEKFGDFFAFLHSFLINLRKTAKRTRKTGRRDLKL